MDRALGAVGAALILATGVVALTSGGGDADASGTPAAATAADRVEIKDFKYLPDAVTVAVGTKLTWTNSDSAPHTATSGTSPNPDKVFESGTMAKGESKSVTVSKPGTFVYYCAFHPFMQATVVAR